MLCERGGACVRQHIPASHHPAFRTKNNATTQRNDAETSTSTTAITTNPVDQSTKTHLLYYTHTATKNMVRTCLYLVHMNANSSGTSGHIPRLKKRETNTAKQSLHQPSRQRKSTSYYHIIAMLKRVSNASLRGKPRHAFPRVPLEPGHASFQ